MSTQSAAAARLARKLEKFNQHERDFGKRARQLSMLEEQEAEHKRLMNRDASLGYERRKKERAIEWEAAHQRRWEDSLRDRHQQEQQDSRFRKSRAAAAREAVMRVRKAAAEDMSVGISEFESRLGSTLDTAEERIEVTGLSSSVSAAEFDRQLARKAESLRGKGGSRTGNLAEAGAFVGAMKRSKAAGNAARERSDEWRRHLMVAIEEEETSRMTGQWCRRIEECAVHRNCRAEDELRKRVFDKMLAYEQYVQQSASLRQARIKLHEQENNTRLHERELSLVTEALRKLKLGIDSHQKQYRILKRQARANESSKACDAAESILEQMLCLAVSAVGHRRVIDAGGDALMDDETWQGWKLAFVEGLFLEGHRPAEEEAGGIFSLDPIISPPDVSAVEGGPDVESGMRSGSGGDCQPEGVLMAASDRMKAHGQMTTGCDGLLDRREVDDYIKGRGQWRLSTADASRNKEKIKSSLTEIFGERLSDDPVGAALWTDVEEDIDNGLTNQWLADAVEYLCRIRHPDKLLKEHTTYSPVSAGVRVLLGGKYLSGRKTLARGLKERYPSVIVVDVDEVVAECIHLGGQLTEAGSSGELKACGQKALDELIGGGSISDDVYIDMILAKLNDELGGDSAVAQHPAAATSPNDGVCGWVLVGFPNKRQLTLLTRRLAGVVPIEHLDTHDRTLDRVLDMAGSSRRPQAVIDPQLDCGYDLRVVIDVPNEELSRRALGRLVDQVSGVVFHIQDDPPPIVAEAVRRASPEVATLIDSLGGDSAAGTMGGPPLPFDASPEEPLAASFGTARTSPKRQKCRISLARTSPYHDSAYPSSILPNLYHAFDEKEEALDRTSAELGRPALRIGSRNREEVLDHLCGVVEELWASRTKDATTSEIGVSSKEEIAPREAADHFTLVEALRGVDVCSVLFLADQWEAAVTAPNGLDEQYRRAFRWVRRCKECSRQGLANIRSLIIKRLEMVDARQSIVNSFMGDFNAFTEEYSDMCRENEETRNELHARVDDVCQRLVVEFVRKKIQASTDIRKQIIASRWAEGVLTTLAAAIQSLFRAEYARFHAVCRLLCDAYSLVLPTEHGGPVLHEVSADEQLQDIDVLGIDDEAVQENRQKFEAFIDEASRGDGDGQQGNVVEAPELTWTACEVRKYINSEGENDQPAQGEWTFPFIDKLADAVRTASEAAPGLLSPWKDPSKLAEPVPDPKAGKGAKKKKAEPTQEELEVKPPPEAYIDYQRAVLREKVLLSDKLTVLTRWANETMLKANNDIENTMADTAHWISLREDAETKTVEQFGREMKRHIEVEGVPKIPCHYTLEQTAVLVHENVLL
ncbi:nucleobase-containing compound kinase activity [Perkinsus olseni]|uniref:Nucleobase-containing compound kinase activity n=1 Tax=Perkinsus olseni TaxID=32597 RepID=A0A7J6NQC1_PEROL|nr:nucleobase-containing compound kinase activity [Perkinsus olseni]